jgi:hypothetical protein
MGGYRVAAAATALLVVAPPEDTLDCGGGPVAVTTGRGLEVRMEINPPTLRRKDPEHVLLPLQTHLHGQQGSRLDPLRRGDSLPSRPQTGREVEANKFQNAQYPPPYLEFTPKQIRERYLNYLRPEISKEEFSLEEDLNICRFVMEQGKHWRKMEEVLPGRTEGCIKGRYYGKLQKIISRPKDHQDS